MVARPSLYYIEKKEFQKEHLSLMSEEEHPGRVPNGRRIKEWASENFFCLTTQDEVVLHALDCCHLMKNPVNPWTSIFFVVLY
tara:strand:+ start:291 stop:539 length:249 start_codon:yes stop_codon:yes gene_type:complete